MQVMLKLPAVTFYFLFLPSLLISSFILYAGDGAATATSVHNVGEGCSFKVSVSENIVQQETGSATKMDPLDFTPPGFKLF